MKALIIFIVCISYSICVLSHTPLDIEVKPNFDNDELHIRIKHPVTDPRDYYIRKVEVIVDKREPIAKRFFFQKGDYKTLTVDIPNLDETGTIVIRAYPRKGKFLEKEFDVNSLKESNEN